MVQIDVKKFLIFKPDEITEAVKEEFYPELCELEIRDVSSEHIYDVCKVMQDILKFKGEQVYNFVIIPIMCYRF